jgi:hypothetical protein
VRRVVIHAAVAVDHVKVEAVAQWQNPNSQTPVQFVVLISRSFAQLTATLPMQQ